MRRLIQSCSVVQRKSFSSFYHSSLSSLFSLPFCCFLSHFQPPIIPSLPHLLALLPHPCPMCPPVLIPPPSLRLQIAYLHVCVLAVWASSCQNHLCTRTRVFVPASVSACIWVVVKKACMVKVCVLSNFMLFCSSELQETGSGWEWGKKKTKKPKNTPNEFFKNNLLSVLSGCEKSWLFWSIARPKPGWDFLPLLINASLHMSALARSHTHKRKPLCDFLSCGFRFSNKRRVVSAAPSASYWAPRRFLKQQKTFWEALCA